MRHRAKPFLMTLFALGGCATQSPLQPLPTDHPAHPEAAVASAAPPSMTLAVNEPVRSASPKTPAMDHGSSGMKHGAGLMRHDDHASHGTAAPPPPAAASQPSAAQGATGPALYACPMHPKVVSTNPNDRCPECKMKINKPVKQAAAPSSAPAAPAGADHAAHGHEHGGH